MDTGITKVGVGVMIFKDGKVLLGKRLNAHGAGVFQSPGGHLDYMETFEECAKRETLEETGLKIDNVRFQLIANLQKFAPKHYVHIGMIADWVSGEPQLMEPDKCGGWDWYALDQLPDEIIVTSKMILDSLQSGQTYFEKV